MLHLILQIGTGLLTVASMILIWGTYRVQRKISLQIKKKHENLKQLRTVIIPPQGHNIVNLNQARVAAFDALVRELGDEAKVRNPQVNSIPAQSNTSAGSNFLGESNGKIAISAR